MVATVASRRLAVALCEAEERGALRRVGRDLAPH